MVEEKGSVPTHAAEALYKVNRVTLGQQHGRLF